MSLLRRLLRVCTGVAFLFVAVVSNASGQSSQSAGSEDPNSPTYHLPAQKPQTGADRGALLASVIEKLNEFKPAGAKKADDDFFVVGTIDLKDHHAAVDYLIKQGVQKTADFIVEFMSGKAPGTVREWRVFARANNLKAAQTLVAKAKSESIESRLAAFKRNRQGKKSPDDFFVIGTADMNNTTLHADIRFEILAGVKNAADFLIDFIFNRPKNHKGEWHVFYRGGTEAEATDYRQQMRDWYDSMEAQRAQLAAIYNAKSTARC